MTDLVYLNNRYHDPTLGTFISVDPLVDVTGEPYIYAGGNPTTLSDPTGLCPTDTAAAAACYAAMYNASLPPNNAGAPPSVQDVHSTTRQKAYNVADVPKCGISACRGPSSPPPTADSEWVCGPSGQHSSSGCDWFEPLDTYVSGQCVAVGGVAGGAAGGAMCVVYDSDEMALVALGEAGGGLGTVGGAAGGATGGLLVSNATEIDQILGTSACGGGGAGAEVAFSGELCFGITGPHGDRERTGIWTFYGGAGLGAGAEGHVVESETVVIARFPNLLCSGFVASPVQAFSFVLSC